MRRLARCRRSSSCFAAGSRGRRARAACTAGSPARCSIPGVVPAALDRDGRRAPERAGRLRPQPRPPLEPASNEKLCVTYAALVELGPPYRFPTEVLGEGERVGGTWRGRLVLKGFGDPALTRAGLERLVDILWREGIRKVTGGIVGDASAFDTTTRRRAGCRRSPGIESPPLSALGRRPGRAATAGWSPTRRWRPRRRSTRCCTRTGSSPAARASAGAGRRPSALATIYSDPLTQMLEFMDQFSDNFTAEMLLKAIGAAGRRARHDGGRGATVVRRGARGGGRPARGRADRRRLRALPLAIA